MQTKLLTLLFLLPLATHAPLLAAQKPERPAPGRALGGADTPLGWDERPDGSLWAVGRSYKAGFEPGVASFVPFFGSSAPRNFPIRLHVRSIEIGGEPVAFDADALPRREGERVVYDRGVVREVYDLGPDRVEQSFVFEGLPRAGTLVVRLAPEGEFERTSDAQGLRFSNALGSVGYSNAVSIDGHGACAAVETRWKDGEIELAVPAAALAAAQGTLTIDPLLTVYPVDTTAFDDLAPDVAYDETSLQQMVVWERVFSAADHDVAYRFLDPNGTPTGPFGYVDATVTYVAHPRVANNFVAHNFMCVAASGDPSGGARSIIGRTVASTGTQGATFTIDNAAPGEYLNPVIGGDNSPASPTYYFVAYEHAVSSSNHDILAKRVSSSGIPQTGGPTLVDRKSVV